MTDGNHPNRYGGNKFPDNFLYDPFEQLQDTLMHVHNRRVKEEFRDLANPNEEWIVNLNTPRARLRVACVIKEEDSADMIVMRMWLFYVILGKAKDFQTPIYGIPIAGFQEARKFKPQITLFFQEDQQDVEQGYTPITGQINFRLMNQETDNLTQVELENYAREVRTAFATGSGYVWKKGRVMASYTDRERGYKLQLLVRTEADAKALINKVLDVQGHTPDWEYLNISENDQATSRYPIVPGTQRILGRTRRLPRKRPIADVRFRSAHLHVWGLPNAITLIDRTGYHRNPVLAIE